MCWIYIQTILNEVGEDVELDVEVSDDDVEDIQGEWRPEAPEEDERREKRVQIQPWEATRRK